MELSITNGQWLRSEINLPVHVQKVALVRHGTLHGRRLKLKYQRVGATQLFLRVENVIQWKDKNEAKMA